MLLLEFNSFMWPFIGVKKKIHITKLRIKSNELEPSKLRYVRGLNMKKISLKMSNLYLI